MLKMANTRGRCCSQHPAMIQSNSLRTRHVLLCRRASPLRYVSLVKAAWCDQRTGSDIDGINCATSSRRQKYTSTSRAHRRYQIESPRSHSPRRASTQALRRVIEGCALPAAQREYALPASHAGSRACATVKAQSSMGGAPCRG